MNGRPDLLRAGPLQLRDGRRVWFRPIEPSDAERMRRFHRRLSSRTHRLRFFSAMPELRPRLARQLTDVDFVERGAVVACHPGEDEIRAVGHYQATGDGAAEVALVVEDAYQGYGIGHVMLDLLVAHLRSRGFERLTAMVLPENTVMLTILRRSGFPLLTLCRDGVYYITIDLSHRDSDVSQRDQAELSQRDERALVA